MSIESLHTFIDGVNHTLFTARHPGEGMLGMVELRHSQRRIAAVRRLYVHKAYRKQGIGRKLMEACCQAAANSHCEVISLLVDCKNVEAQWFYKKIGFTFSYQDDEDFGMSKQLLPVGTAAVPSTKLWPKRDGMRQSIHGVLRRLVPKLNPENDPEAYRTVLGELDEHLDSLALAFYSGDYAAVDQFLQLYDLDAVRAERQK